MKPSRSVNTIGDRASARCSPLQLVALPREELDRVEPERARAPTDAARPSARGTGAPPAPGSAVRIGCSPGLLEPVAVDQADLDGVRGPLGVAPDEVGDPGLDRAPYRGRWPARPRPRRPGHPTNAMAATLPTERRRRRGPPSPGGALARRGRRYRDLDAAGLGLVPRRPPGAVLQAARRALPGDPRRRHRRGRQVRRAPRIEPRRRRAHPRPAPGVRLATRRDPVGHRATSPTPTRSSPGAGTASTSCARPTGSRATRAGPSPSTTGSRTATPRPSSSYADGFALAQDAARRPEARRRIVAVIGDGSMTGGMAYEGLNNLGHSGRKAIIILNDNGRSYAPTISRLAENVARIRLNPSYMKQRARLERLVRDVPGRRRPPRLGHGRRDRRHARDVRAAGVLRVARRPLHGAVRRPRHRGPGAGAAPRGRLRRSDRRARPHPEGPGLPAGRGGRRAAPARQRRCSTSPPARPPAPSGKPSYTQAFSEALIKEAEVRPEVVAITAAMPGSTGLLPFAGPLPRPHDRRRHRRAARGHLRGGHGDGRAAPGRRDLLDLPRRGPSTRPTSTWACTTSRSCSASTGAGITGANGASHHGVLDMVLHDEGAGHDRLRAVVVPGAAGDAPRRARHHERARPRSAGRTPRPASVGEDEIGHGLSARKVRDGRRHRHRRRRQAAGRSRGGRRASSRPTACRPRCGTRGS